MNRDDFINVELFDIKGQKQDFIGMKLQHALLLNDSYTTRIHKNDFFQIIFITGGTGVQYIDLQAFEVKKGDLIFLNTWQQHRWSFNSTTEGYILSFRPCFLTQFVSDHLFVHDLPFFKRFTAHHILETEGELNHTIQNAIHQIIKEYEIESKKQVNLIRTYLLEILLLCKKEIDNDILDISNNGYSNELVKSFETLIDKHFYEYRFPKEYAKVLLVTPNYLNAVCRKIKNKSAGDMIRDRILIECKRLLINTNLSASEIAYQLNFKDNSYFSQFFKKHIGIAPDEFRRK